nr:alcohol dehydrogenase [Raoultella sp. NCTC 9187]
MVKAAYSSGKPAIGVGAGNTPVVIDETADIKRAVASVLMSKTFDNGVICASEQSVVVVDSVYDAVRERFASHGGYLLQGKELKAVQDIILKKRRAERRYRWSAGIQNCRTGRLHRSDHHQNSDW